jgi:hypothetical protein
MLGKTESAWWQRCQSDFTTRVGVDGRWVLDFRVVVWLQPWAMRRMPVGQKTEQTCCDYGGNADALFAGVTQQQMANL